ncbi:MAG: DUF362 domain-containing protein [Thermodesulfobacteriota bacterium]
MKLARKPDIDIGRRLLKARFRGDWPGPVGALLEASGLGAPLASVARVIVMPNLVEALKPPITTPVGIVEAAVDFIATAAPKAEIIVADGTGSLDYDTFHCFDELGYTDMAHRMEDRGVRLMDLNTEPTVCLSPPGLKAWPEIHLPKIIMESYLISIPVLKAHTLSGVTLTMKNMFGAAPPEFYQQGGNWRKSAFHERIHESVFDVNLCRTPDFTLLDATVGMSTAHLWGPECDPPVGLIVCGFDPVAIDACGTELLGRDPDSIGHIVMANGVIGNSAYEEVVEIDY